MFLRTEEFVNSFETHGTVFGRVLVMLQNSRTFLRFQDGSFSGVAAPGYSGVCQGLAQSAVPEQGIVEDPIHPVSQCGDGRVLPMVQARGGTTQKTTTTRGCIYRSQFHDPMWRGSSFISSYQQRSDVRGGGFIMWK